MSYVPKGTRRPCKGACGGNTLHQDYCHECRHMMKATRGLGESSQHGHGCRMCEGMNWRRPQTGKCKCGKRFAPEMLSRDACLRQREDPFVKF